jgi:cobalt-zinc-cadmium efflux system membrane fusion protein
MNHVGGGKVPLSITLVLIGHIMLNGCAKVSGVQATNDEGPAIAASSPPGTAMPLVIVPPDSPQAKQLRVESVRAQPVPEDEVGAPARIMINPNRISRVLPPVQGRITTVSVKLGDNVSEGQPLVTMDSPDVDTAISVYLQTDAAVRQANVTVSKTEADVKRAKNLLPFQGISEKDAQAAENDFAAAQSALATAQATREQSLRKLTLLGLKPADFHQAYVVRAPIAGVITDINVTPGEYRAAIASPGDIASPLMSIADLSTVWVACDVPEPSIRLIHVGDGVDIHLVAYPGETFTGRVARMASTLDPQTRTLRVHVDLPNPQRRFVPEMFGTIRHPGLERTIPVVPSAAIVEEYGHSEVFVEVRPGEFERRLVTTGFRSRDNVAVTSGLRVHERVIVDGAILLKGQ